MTCSRTDFSVKRDGEAVGLQVELINQYKKHLPDIRVLEGVKVQSGISLGWAA